MNSLDELFGEALAREATTPSAQRLEEVADGTVGATRRRRRIRAAGEAVAALVVVGIAVGVGSVVLGGGGANPANTDAPEPSASVPSDPAPQPSVAVTSFGAEDPRMPFESPMTPEDWAAVDATWDVELAAFTNDGGSGSTAQVYLTAPGGERTFAYAYPDFALPAPILLAYDPAAATMLVYDADMKTLNSVDLATGVATETANMLGATIEDARPLGRTSSGAGVFALETTDDAGSIATTVFVTGTDSAAGVATGDLTVSPVWGNRVVIRENRVLTVMDVTGTTSAREFTDLQDCEFLAWNTDGTFRALCAAQGETVGKIIAVDPGTGATTDVQTDVSLPPEAFQAEISEHAIDGARQWMGEATSGRGIHPPFVMDGPEDSEGANLGTGFSATLDAYTVIFGVRG